MASKILITGSTGFIGRHLTAALESRGYTVYGLSSKDGDIARSPLSCDPVDHVFHLAGRSFVPDSWKTPVAFYETNVMGAANVLEFCRSIGASITLMSSYVYGTPQRLPISEEHPTAASNPYAHSKIVAEEIAMYYYRTFKVRVTVIRAFNVYGSGQDERFLIPLLIGQAVDAERETLEVADGRPRRDYLYIDDLIGLLLATIGYRGGIYNAGSGSSVSVAELASLINRLAGTRKRLVTRNEERPGEILDVIADITKANRDLDWKPRTSLEHGVAATIETMAGLPAVRK